MFKFGAKMISVGVLALVGVDALADSVGFENFPWEIVGEVSRHVSLEDARNMRLVNKFTSSRVADKNSNQIFNPAKFEKKFENIERLLELENYISLPNLKQSQWK